MFSYVLSCVCFPSVLSDSSCAHLLFMRMSTCAFGIDVYFHMFFMCLSMCAFSFFVYFHMFCMCVCQMCFRIFRVFSYVAHVCVFPNAFSDLSCAHMFSCACPLVLWDLSCFSYVIVHVFSQFVLSKLSCLLICVFMYVLLYMCALRIFSCVFICFLSCVFHVCFGCVVCSYAVHAHFYLCFRIRRVFVFVHARVHVCFWTLRVSSYVVNVFVPVCAF